MTKHPYQTCLRMPLTLKEDMTTICDRYQINEVRPHETCHRGVRHSHPTEPNQTSRHMFSEVTPRISLGHDTDKDPVSTLKQGLFAFD